MTPLPARRPALRDTVATTPAPGCPACEYRRRHTDAETARFHPWAGHGFSTGQWSHPFLGGEAERARRTVDDLVPYLELP